MKRRSSSVFVALLVIFVAQQMHACEFLSFSKEILKDLFFSVRFKCDEASASDQLFKAIGNTNVTEVGSVLYEHPALLDTAEDRDGVTPLLAAAIAGHDGIVAHMLSREPKPQVDRCGYQGFTIINMNGKTCWLPLAGFTPLMAAAKLNHKNIVKQLISAGAKKELADLGNPPKKALDYAKESGNIEIVALLH